MKDFEKAFKPLDWQGNIAGMTEEGYKEHIEKVHASFLDCGTEAGKETLNLMVNKLSKLAVFGQNMVSIMKENADKVAIVTDTDLLVGYVAVDQLTSSVKYYIDYRVSEKLKADNKVPKTAEEVFKFFITTIGFMPVKFKSASLCDLSESVSYKFSTIKRILEEGDNTDAWSNTMKVQLLAGFTHLEYLPSESKYYFVTQGNHGWYLKADTERNDIIKKKQLARIKKEKEKAEAAEAKEDTAVDAVEAVETTEAPAEEA